MKKILVSVATLGVIGALVAGATGAFYGDTERSTGNTFMAGAVELRVDSESHYNGLVCVEVDDDVFQWQNPVGADPVGPEHYPQPGDPCDGTWSETDLEDGIHRFFNFTDLKPGDSGEDTLSLHVYDNPAWGQFSVENVVDRDNTCTEPEATMEADDVDNTEGCVDPDGNGEIDKYLVFSGWVDQGSVPGFQCGDTDLDDTGARCAADPTEGDNVWQRETELLFWNNENINDLSHDLDQALGAQYQVSQCSVEDGDTDYAECHGLASDGRMVGSATYYFGLAWEFPLEATNDAMTDEFTADMVFRVEQHRNNPNPFQVND
jgi:hypothetical protein